MIYTATFNPSLDYVMMSVDFGGPINKTAYVFGTAAIAGGQFDIMAAVMIGGMQPEY